MLSLFAINCFLLTRERANSLALFFYGEKNMTITKTTITKLLIIIIILLLPFVLEANEYKRLWNRETWTFDYPSNPPSTRYISPSFFKQIGNLTHFLGLNNAATLPDIGYIAPKGVVVSHDNIHNFYEVDVNTYMFVYDFFVSANAEYGVIFAYNNLLFVENPATNPSISKKVSRNELPNFGQGANPLSLDLRGFAPLKVGDTDFYFYAEQKGLAKLNYEMTEELAYFPFPDNHQMWTGVLGNAILAGKNTLLLKVNHPNHNLLEFDVINEEWTIYDNTNLPVDLQPRYWDYKTKTSFAYHLDRSFNDWDELNPKPIISISSRYRTEGNQYNGYNYYYDRGFLYFNRVTEQWDTIRIDLSEVEEFKDNHYHYGISAYPIYSLGKIVIVPVPGWNGEMAIKFTTNFILYDWETKTFETVALAPPDSLFTYTHNMLRVTFANCFTDAEGNQVIGLLYNNEDFIIYNPTTNVFERVEFILPNLWFRSLYPNPIKQGTPVTANIMCYLPSISDVELGLYDFMGQKVLDLSNQFEYEPATATIHITFEIPKSLAKGSYFLVVRSGKETRTKGIIVQ